VEEDAVVINVRVTLAFEIIAGKEVTQSQHIGEIVGDFVSADKVNFPTVI